MKVKLQDSKEFLIGLVASLTAVALWDVIKYRYKIFNYKKEIKDIQK